MKARRILVAVALILCFATVLVSCNKSTHASIDDIFNPDYEAPVSTLTTYKALDDLGELYEYNDAFLIFEKENEETGHSVYSVYSNYTNTVIKTYTVEDGKDFGFEFSDECEVLLFVVTATWDAEADPLAVPDVDMALDLLDAKGNTVASYTEDDLDIEDLMSMGVDSFVKMVTLDLIEMKNGLYRVAKDGAITLVKQFLFTEVPEIQFENENYFYAFDNYALIIYDKEFKLVSTYKLPSYADGETFLLADGNILVQYMVQLPDDASEYDLLDDTEKYALTTQIVSAKTGEAKDVKDANYTVDFLYSKAMMEYIGVDAEMYAEGFENIAALYYIDEDTKMVDRSTESYVYLSNGGKVEQDLKIANNVEGLPSYLAKGVYAAELADDTVMILDAEGKELAVVQSMGQVFDGQFIEADGAIYKLDGTKVYDLKANKAEIVYEYDLSALVIAEEKIDDVDTDVVYLFIDGEMKKVAELGDGVEFDSHMNYYEVYNAETDKTSFYNQKGDLIKELDGYFMYGFTCHDGALIVDAEGNYHKFIYDVIPDRFFF